jgi:hypothetical protein
VHPFVFLSLWTEKKLLHSKLRNIPVNEKVNIIEKSSADKRDASTATEDLGDPMYFIRYQCISILFLLMSNVLFRY